MADRYRGRITQTLSFLPYKSVWVPAGGHVGSRPVRRLRRDSHTRFQVRRPSLTSNPIKMIGQDDLPLQTVKLDEEDNNFTARETQ